MKRRNNVVMSLLMIGQTIGNSYSEISYTMTNNETKSEQINNIKTNCIYYFMILIVTLTNFYLVMKRMSFLNYY